MRLTNSIRNDIVNKAIQISPLHKVRKELITQQQEIANKIRVYLLGGKDKADAYEKIYQSQLTIRESLPEILLGYGSIIHTGTNITLQLEGRTGRECLMYGKTCVTPRTPYNFKLTKDNPYYEELLTNVEKEDKISKQFTELRNSLNATLANITTIAKLRKEWPEVDELLPPSLTEPKPKLPALKVDHLNKLIGLPTSKD